jgi:hypothetical protein
MPALPDPCLLAVLQCCAADDQRSLFSAARAHSRLHQTAIAALHSISAAVPEQQQVDSVLQYLDRHGSHVDSLKLRGPDEDELTLCQLPPSLQLHSLVLAQFHVRLLPGNGSQGVLGAAADAAARAPPLTQLQLNECTLLDGVKSLVAALRQLHALEHLSLYSISETPFGKWVCFPTGVLQQLQQLTYLELAYIALQGPDPAGPFLQPLTALTRLADLRLGDLVPERQRVTASILSGMCHLTRLAVISAAFEPAALADKPKLQHLELAVCTVQPPVGGSGLVALLSQLQQQTQLTHLDLRHSVRMGAMGAAVGRNPPAAAYAALTASSKLQHLSISECRLPADVWQHLFPADRQLQHLTSLDISAVDNLSYGASPAPEGSRLVSCCPSLQSLNLCYLRYRPQQLTQLQGLSGLHTLRLLTGTAHQLADNVPADTGETLQAVCQLTGLRKLGLTVDDAPTQRLVTQLQQLQRLPHLTVLDYSEGTPAVLKQEVGGSP